MHKLFSTAAILGLGCTSLAVGAVTAHGATPTVAPNDATHYNSGCYVNWLDYNTSHEQGYNGTDEHTVDPPVTLTDPALTSKGYTTEVTVHNRIEMDGGLSSMNFTVEHNSNRVDATEGSGAVAGDGF